MPRCLLLLVTLLAVPLSSSAQVVARTGASPLTGFAGFELDMGHLSLSAGWFGEQTGFERRTIYGSEPAEVNPIFTFGGTLYQKAAANSPFVSFAVMSNASSSYSYDSTTGKETVEWTDDMAVLVGYRVLFKERFDARAGLGSAWRSFQSGTDSGVAFEASIGYRF